MTTCHISILVLLILSTPLSFSEKCHPNDKKALLQFKKDLNNPHLLISWKPNTNCCGWHGIKCDEKTNRVTNIDLIDSNFQLPIPAAIGDLQYLESFSFYNTSFTGQIPHSVSKLSNLESFDVRKNLLTGLVPASLGKLKKLGYVGLSSNRLGGDLSFLFGKGKKLMGVEVSRNQFEFNLTNVKFFKPLFNRDLSHNKIYGSLPKDLSRTGITTLDVSYNNLCGPIPKLNKAQLFDKSAFMINKCLCGKPLPPCK